LTSNSSHTLQQVPRISSCGGVSHRYLVIAMISMITESNPVVILWRYDKCPPDKCPPDSSPAPYLV